METQIEICEASASDAAAILEIQKLAFHGQGILYNDFTLPPLVQTLEDLVQDFKKHVFLKALYEGTIVGSIRGRAEGGTCFISRLFVHPDHQNKGIGKKLMHAVENKFGDALRYELYTGHKSEKSLAFYAKLGYQEFERKPQSAKVMLICLEKGKPDICFSPDFWYTHGNGKAREDFMDSIFSDRITDVPRSFIREILKVALDPTVISFAGGLPNRNLFPAEEIREATNKVFGIHGRDIFQYSNSEGYLKLREYIAERYRRKKKLTVPVENILITSGSQQGLDLLGKVLLNDGDSLVIEEPGYLGAIQAFSIYQPQFLPIPVSEQGMDAGKLRKAMSSEKPKLMYSVPNFQNPSGISYSRENRTEIAKILQGTKTILIEDDPYGELRFEGEDKPSFKELLPNNTVMLGSFSKTIVPGFRLGWIAAPKSIMEKLIIAKQATDLHTSHFTQAIICQYLTDNDVDSHISRIRTAYGNQCRAMLRSIGKHFPSDVSCTRPEGGMFVWAELPKNAVALDLFDIAVRDKVIFVPGDPFYVNKKRTRTMRLNFSCVDEETIEIGISRLGAAIREFEQ